ncbi:MAG: FAD-dependent oxidoreductase [Acidobacteriaceae bacterium]
MNPSTYDFAIIGAGSAGLIAADFAVKLGARVIMLERDRIGGDCTWTGCVPSKALLKVASVAHDARTGAAYGVHSSQPTIDMPQVRDYLRGAIEHIYAPTTPDALRAKGMQIALGPVSFLDAHTLSAGEQRISARKILIATGADPLVPSLPGLSDVPFSTYRDIFNLDRLPASMTIVGGGPVGVEMAQAYQRLGVQVAIVAERLLPKEEPEVSTLLQRVLTSEGIRVIAERAASIERTDGLIRVRTANTAVDSEKLVVAAGRTPAVKDLRLEAAGVRHTEDGVSVNRRLQTSVRNIYAAGDVLGGAQFSHFAGWQGFQAARNALLPGSNSGFSSTLPRITFTDPEVAQVGLLEHEARTQGLNGLHIGCWGLERIDRAVCDNDRDGFIKIIANSNGTILGATIVGRRAGDAIMELVMAIAQKMTVAKLAGIIHPYPTYSTGVQLLVTEMAMQQAFSGASGRLIRSASKFAR